MTPAEAASSRWSNLGAHQTFASGVQEVLTAAQRSIEAGIEGADIASVTKEGNPPPPTRSL